MPDTKLLENQIAGLDTKIKDLRKEEKVFLKVSGIEETIEKTRIEVGELETDIQAEKEDIADLKKKKYESLKKTVEAFQKTMDQILPYGVALFKLDDDGSVFIGFMQDEQITPYPGLSGGEKVIFDSALSYALMGHSENKVLIFEAAELDEVNLKKTLEHLQESNPDAQIIVNSCHMPQEIPEGWELTKFE